MYSPRTKLETATDPLPTASCTACRSSDPRQHEALLRQRFGELGPVAVSFLDGLLVQRQGRSQAGKVLALLGSYARADLLAALERAVRFGAYSHSAVERI